MRFKLTMELSATITYRVTVAEHVILWIGLPGTIRSDPYISVHPLASVYYEIRTNRTLQVIKNDIYRRKRVLILFASLVLL